MIGLQLFSEDRAVLTPLEQMVESGNILNMKVNDRHASGSDGYRRKNNHA